MEIESGLLMWLLERFKPYQPQKPGLAVGYTDKVTKADGTLNIKRLCERARIQCDSQQIEAIFPED